jgi:hypothetical protein
MNAKSFIKQIDQDHNKLVSTLGVNIDNKLNPTMVKLYFKSLLFISPYYYPCISSYSYTASSTSINPLTDDCYQLGD